MLFSYKMTFNKLICLTNLIALTVSLASCAEKKAEVAPAKPASSSSPTPSGDPANSAASGGYDVCADGLKKADLASSFLGLVTKLCDNGDLAKMRTSEFVYNGGDVTKVRKDYEKQSAEETSLNIFTSALLETKPKFYYDFVRLEFSKPAMIKGDDDDCTKADPFVCDPSVTLSDIQASGSTVTYHYQNTGNDQGGVISYSATSKFTTLSPDQTYLVATELNEDEAKETVTKMVALIVINKNGEKTEVITISDQAYSYTAEEKSAFNSQLASGLNAEQKRAFANGQQAEKAAALLTP